MRLMHFVSAQVHGAHHQAATGQEFQAEKLISGMLEAFAGDPNHRCTGRSAPARLARALQQADAAGLAVPQLREIAAGQQH